jgi:YesN/AraC family two-component response regulator
MSAVEILIADDHELVRKGLISILGKSHPEWTVVAEASNGREAGTRRIAAAERGYCGPVYARY